MASSATLRALGWIVWIHCLSLYLDVCGVPDVTELLPFSHGVLRQWVSCQVGDVPTFEDIGRPLREGDVQAVARPSPRQPPAQPTSTPSRTPTARPLHSTSSSRWRRARCSPRVRRATRRQNLHMRSTRTYAGTHSNRCLKIQEDISAEAQRIVSRNITVRKSTILIYILQQDSWLSVWYYPFVVSDVC